MQINEMAQAAYENSNKKGFHDGPFNVPEKLMLIVSEASEALEDYRNGNMTVRYEYKDGNGDTFLLDEPSIPMTDGSVVLGKPVGFPSEIADIIIRCGDLMGRMGLDLDAVVTEKMAYNATRPFKHGGKKC